MGAVAILVPIAPLTAAEAATPFRATISLVPAEYQRKMVGVSWHAGCPVPIRDLRLITMTYRGFDSKVRMGRLMVHKGISNPTVRAFKTLYANGFPIRRMELIETYKGSDNASMAADNTSAFNCRRVTGSSTRWSNHSYGRAIDINPVENPYVKGSTVLPPSGRSFVRRSPVRAGMIPAGSYVVRAFASAGMTWGGNYRTLKDYQHFERT